jgi:hypothetical protein
MWPQRSRRQPAGSGRDRACAFRVQVVLDPAWAWPAETSLWPWPQLPCWSAGVPWPPYGLGLRVAGTPTSPATSAAADRIR